jgi:hypothetical protein
MAMSPGLSMVILSLAAGIVVGRSSLLLVIGYWLLVFGVRCS